MRSSKLALSMVGALLTLALGSVSLLATSPTGGQAQAGGSTEADYQLLTNPSLEAYDPAYGQWLGIACQVASGWSRFFTGGSEPCWLDTRVFADSWLGGGWIECIAGDTCQMIVSTEPYTAGLWQQVSGLTPGNGYGFHAALLTIYQSSAQPRVDGTMIKRVGVDPTGGIDPAAPSVVWGEPDDTDKVWDVQRRVAAFAEVPTMTVFIEIDSPLDAGLWPFMNQSFLDSAILAQTPPVVATSPEVSLEPSFAVSWGEVEPAPGGGTVEGVDVQVMDEGEGIWRDWLFQTFETGSEYSGEPGHRYWFRARAWQSYPNGAWLHGPYRAGGDSSTQVAGGRLAGLVLSPVGWPVPGATVAVSGTDYVAETGRDGRFDVAVPTLSGTREILVSHPVWVSPPPVSSPAFGLTTTVALTWSLRPPADAVTNGQFEQGLQGWSVSGDPDRPPSIVADPVHSGIGALSVGGGAEAGVSTAISQTVVLTGAWQPALSLWYQPVVTSTDAHFNLVMHLSGHGADPTEEISTTVVLTPELERASWMPLFAGVGPPRVAITGTVELELRLWTGSDGLGATVFVDEVSLGGMPGGPYGVYLPLIVRSAG